MPQDFVTLKADNETVIFRCILPQILFEVRPEVYKIRIVSVDCNSHPTKAAALSRRGKDDVGMF